MDSSAQVAERNRVVIIAILLFTLVFCGFLIFIDENLSEQHITTVVTPQQTIKGVFVSALVTVTPFQPAHHTTTNPVQLPTVSQEIVNLAEMVTTPETEWMPGERYVVKEGESLQSIAAITRSSEEGLRAANFLYGDALLVGQTLIVPENEPVTYPAWMYASIDKDLADQNYPLVLPFERFRYHYMPNTVPAVDPTAVANMVNRGLSFVEESFGKPLEGDFDLYAAGTLYEPPNKYLRGRSFSLDRKVFFLHDGSGDAVHQQYFAAHEVTHLYAWNTFGQPYSFLVSEGAAVYTGMKMIEGSDYMPIKTFCAAYKQENRLPSLYDKVDLADWRGHSNNLVNYFSAGCLVGYLIETYGVEKFGQIYPTHDFTGVYGKTLPQLEEEWKASIDTSSLATQIDTGRLVRSVNQFIQANIVFYDHFTGSSESILAYRLLDRARLSLLKGDFDQFDQDMTVYQNARLP